MGITNLFRFCTNLFENSPFNVNCSITNFQQPNILRNLCLFVGCFFFERFTMIIIFFIKQGRRKLFDGGGLSKVFGRHSLPTSKIWKKKKHWLKRPKAVPQKTKFGPKFKWFKISYLKLLFWKYFFGHTIFLYSSTRSSGHHQSFFLISDFLAESLKTSKNYQKRSLILQYSFAQKASLILWTSTHLTLKIICFRNTAKNLLDFTTSFLVNMFLFGCRKNICTPPFLDAQNCILAVLWKQMSVYFCIYAQEKFCSKDVVRFYLMGGGLGWGWIISLRGSRCLSLVKYFTIFLFHWNFWKFNYFSAFWYFHL